MAIVIAMMRTLLMMIMMIQVMMIAIVIVIMTIAISRTAVQPDFGDRQSARLQGPLVNPLVVSKDKLNQTTTQLVYEQHRKNLKSL